MAGKDQSGSDWLLRGAFGSLQQSALQGADTASVWQTLRTTVGQWAFQAQGGGEQPSDAELEEAGRQILSANGVGIQQVNQYRAVAGQWRQARENLRSLDETDPVTASTIFRPPWAQTSDPGVDERYRIRVQWEITPEVGDTFTKWSSYELTSPITTIDDVLNQAGAKAAGDRYLFLLSGGNPPDVANYEIEQI